MEAAARRPSTPPWRTAPGCTTTGSAARTTSPPTAPRATRCSRLPGDRAVRDARRPRRVRELRPGGPHARSRAAHQRPAGTVGYIDADLRDTQQILRAAARTLDFSQPVAIMLIAVMRLIVDAEDPYGIVGQLKDAMSPGSYLALSQLASDIEPERMAEAARQYNMRAHETQRHRTHAEVARFFDGLELVEPGVVVVPQWRPRSTAEGEAHSGMWGGVGRRA